VNAASLEAREARNRAALKEELRVICVHLGDMGRPFPKRLGHPKLLVRRPTTAAEPIPVLPDKGLGRKRGDIHKSVAEASLAAKTILALGHRVRVFCVGSAAPFIFISILLI